MAYEDIRWASLGGLSEEPPQRVKDFGYTTSTGTNEGTSEAPILQWTNWQFNKIYQAIENLAAGGLPPDGGGTLITERSGVNVILNGDFSEGTAYWSFSGTAAELSVEDEPLAISGKVGVWTPTGASTMTADPVVIPLPIQNVLGAVDFQYKTDSDDFSVLVYHGANVIANYPIPSSTEYASIFEEVPLPAAGEQVFVRFEATSAGSITLSGIQLGATGLEAVLDGTTMSPSLAGEVIDYAGNTVPSGWLECDGSVVEKTAYPDLYNAIGDTYATTNYFSDDGSLNTYPAPPSGSFRLPDYRNAYLCDSSVSGLGDALEDTTAVNGLSASTSVSGAKNQFNANTGNQSVGHTHNVIRASTTSSDDGLTDGEAVSWRCTQGSLGNTVYALQSIAGTPNRGKSGSQSSNHTHALSYSGNFSATGTTTLTGDAVTRPKSFIVKKIIRCWNSTASGMGAPIADADNYGMITTGEDLDLQANLTVDGSASFGKVAGQIPSSATVRYVGTSGMVGETIYISQGSWMTSNLGLNDTQRILDMDIPAGVWLISGSVSVQKGSSSWTDGALFRAGIALNYSNSVAGIDGNSNGYGCASMAQPASGFVTAQLGTAVVSRTDESNNVAFCLKFVYTGDSPQFRINMSATRLI